MPEGNRAGGWGREKEKSNQNKAKLTEERRSENTGGA